MVRSLEAGRERESSRGQLSLARRFASHTTQAASGCVLWTACKNRRGYGYFRVYGKLRIASRVAWELANGTIPDEMCVLHHCDNPSCVNPAHLFLGTKADNGADMVAKGRQARGDRHGSRLHPGSRQRGSLHVRAKLTEADVLAILGDKRSKRIVAKEYGVSHHSIHLIRHRKTWRHVTEAVCREA